MPARYAVERVLGQGAMGRVLLARDSERDRRVAVKVLLSGAGAGPELLQRFSREARIMTLVEHPHLVRVLEFDTRSDPPFLVMEAVEGVSLLERTRESGPLGLAPTLRLVAEIGQALDALHAKGILHRDLKPGNVMLREPDGSAVLMDLGLASYADFTVITHSGQLLGTPRYLPPEVVRGGTWSERGDLFQLGAVAFEALTGIHMVQARSFDELPGVIVAGAWADFPETIGPVPGHVETAIRRMTALDPQDRFDSGAAFSHALASGSGAMRAPAARPLRAPSGADRLVDDSAAAPPAPPGLRLPIVLLGVALVLLAALALGLFPRSLPTTPDRGAAVGMP